MPLDPESRRFREEVDAVVRRWAGDDEREYWRRWKQLGNLAMDRTQGDVVKKSALKTRMMEKTGGRCEDCGQELPAPALQLHRLKPDLAYLKSENFGYTESNVVLLCAPCHGRR